MKEDTAKVSMLREISISLQMEQPDEAVKWAEKGLALATSLKSDDGIARCNYTKAIALDVAGKTQEAVAQFEIAKSLFEKLGNTEYVGNCMNSAGVALFYGGDYNKAMENYLGALAHWKKYPDELRESQTLNNIGVIYRNQQKYDKAIEIYERSAALKKKLGDTEGYAASTMNIGIAWSYLKNYEKSIEYINEALEIYTETNNTAEIVRCRSSLGVSLLQTGKYAEAENQLEASYSSDMDPQIVPIHILSLIKAEVNLKKYDEAIAHGNNVMEMLGDSSQLETRKQLELELALAQAGVKNFEAAYSHLQKHTELTTQLQTDERMQEIEKLEAQFETKQRQQDLEIANLKIAENKKSEQLLYGGIVLALLLLSLAVYVVLNKTRNNKKLGEKNSLIQKALSEKEILLREIHHRVKNNLQVVSSLLSIQSREIQDEKALEAVNESRNRVKSMAIIHQNLYSEENLTGIDVGDYIRKLSESLFNSYKVDKDEIVFETDIDKLNLDVDTTIPLGLILNELITNALKYAFSNSINPKLRVSLKETSEGLKLEVSDNGVGYNPDSARKDSFGMKMIEAFAQKLNAQWEVKNENGTVVTMVIKSYKKAA
ncbi:MAG: tetratricopeptide repeat protein [Flavobacteriales bacterium]|nr:tetratricopeptide repeat protein [Flavobacteriales bacterium]